MSNSSAFTSMSMTLANGMVEIAALTTLIGSSTAEALSLGNKGASGLVWATMSTFGVYSVVKACVAASTPDWLRETIGVRNDIIDSVVGLNLDLKMNFRSRNRIGGAIGVSCAIKPVS